MRYTTLPFFDCSKHVPVGTPEKELSSRVRGWAESAGILAEAEHDASAEVDDVEPPGEPGRDGHEVETAPGETLESLGVSIKAIDLLAAADPPITTPAAARAHVATYGDFVDLAGIGTATSNHIVASIG